MSAAAIVGHRIAKARTAKGLTLRAVAKQLGLSVPFVHDVEHGRRSIAADRRAAFAEVLGLSVLDLMELDSATLEAVADKLANEGCDATIIRRLRSMAKAGVL